MSVACCGSANAAAKPLAARADPLERVLQPAGIVDAAAERAALQAGAQLRTIGGVGGVVGRDVHDYPFLDVGEQAAAAAAVVVAEHRDNADAVGRTPGLQPRVRHLPSPFRCGENA